LHSIELVLEIRLFSHLTLTRRFLEPANSTHRQYEALRAFFVEGLPSAEAAARFGYTPGSFLVLVHHFRNRPDRDAVEHGQDEAADAADPIKSKKLAQAALISSR
jgi:hypothetical protein